MAKLDATFQVNMSNATPAVADGHAGQETANVHDQNKSLHLDHDLDVPDVHLIHKSSIALAKARLSSKQSEGTHSFHSDVAIQTENDIVTDEAEDFAAVPTLKRC